jgi:hypothetical protein
VFECLIAIGLLTGSSSHSIHEEPRGNNGAVISPFATSSMGVEKEL